MAERVAAEEPARAERRRRGDVAPDVARRTRPAGARPRRSTASRADKRRRQLRSPRASCRDRPRRVVERGQQLGEDEVELRPRRRGRRGRASGRGPGGIRSAGAQRRSRGRGRPCAAPARPRGSSPGRRGNRPRPARRDPRGRRAAGSPAGSSCSWSGRAAPGGSAAARPCVEASRNHASSSSTILCRDRSWLTRRRAFAATRESVATETRSARV